MKMESKQLKYKEISWDDLDDIHNLYSTPKVAEYNSIGIPSSKEFTKNEISPIIEDQKNEVRKKYCWSILEKDKLNFVGLIGIDIYDDRFKLGKIYFFINPLNWNNGFGTESVQRIIKFSFEKLNLHRIEAGTQIENIQSIHVLEKSGFINEGIRRKLLPVNGSWYDCFHFSIIEGDNVGINFPETINRIEDALQIIHKIRHDVESNSTDPFYNHNTLNPHSFFTDIWFRGEAEDYKSTALIPKIFRQDHDETTITNYLPTYVQELRNIEHDFDRLCYMQHYGAPTRLLDWTDSILVALYFAVNSESKEDGVLYILNSRLLNKYSGLRAGKKNILSKNQLGTKYRYLMSTSDTINEWSNNLIHERKDFDWTRSDLNKTPIDEVFDLGSVDLKGNVNEEIKLYSTPVSVRPDKSNSRISQQGGLFTLHGGKVYPADATESEKERIPKPYTLLELNELGKFLKKIKVTKESKAKIKKDLLAMQVHTGTMFPELEKQEDFIKLIGTKNM